MKKKLIGLLASLACLACFAGCNNPLYSGDSSIDSGNAPAQSSSTIDGAQSYDVKGAAAYIESMYKNKNKTGRIDYEVVKKVLYDGDLYTIAWSVNVDCVTVVEEDDKFIIDVDETTTVDTPFILTATLTAPDGSTAKVDLERILTAAPSKVPAQITGDPVEGTEYKLYVYQAANKKDLYINGKMKNTYYFDTTDSFEEGISIYVEKTQGGFYLYHNAVEAEGEAPVKTYINIVKSGTHTNAKYETTASSVFVYDETLGTMVVNLDGTKYYLGADGTFNTVEPQSKLEDGYYMGYLVSLVDASSVTAEDKVEQTLKELSIAPVYVGNNEIELAKQGIRFADTKISWTVEGAGAVLDGNKLSLTAQSAASEITLKATAKNGEVSDEAELKFKLVPNTAAEIVKAATSLKAGESFGNSVELTGIVTAIPTPYAEQYANVTVSMLVEGKTIDAYRLVGVGADVLAKGYTVTVMGVITNYNGTVQFGQGCEIVSFVEGDESNVPEAPTYTMAEIVDMAYDLAPGAKLDGTQTLKGVITKINTPYDAGYGNITVTIVVEGKEDKPIECYRLKGDEAASLKVGDTITVSGTIKHYSYDGTSVGKIEFDAGCTIDAYEAGEGGVVTPPDDGGETPDDGGETPVVPSTPAEIVDAAWALEKGASLEGTQTLTGVIAYVDTAYSSEFSNVSVVIIVDGKTDKPILCYRMKGTGADVIGKADVITVTGTLTNYNGTIEFTSGCTLDSYVLHVCSEYTEATCESPALCVECDEALAGSVAVDHVYVDGACKWCSAPEGVSTITASKLIADLIASEGWTSSTTKQEFALDDVVSVKVDGGNNTGKAYNGDHIRIYATDTPAGTLTISVAAGYELVSIKVSTVEGTYAFLYAGDGTTDICNTTTAVSGSSVVLTSVKNGENGKQIRVTAIEVVYKAV